MGEGFQSDTEDGFDGALRGLRGELTSQLTLAACLFRLCAQVSLHLYCTLLSMNGQAQNNWLQALGLCCAPAGMLLPMPFRPWTAAGIAMPAQAMEVSGQRQRI